MNDSDRAATNSKGQGSHWLDAERLRVYPFIFMATYVLVGAGWWLTATDLIDLQGKPLGYDFITFWSAAQLALAGTPALAYDPGAIFEFQQLAVPANEKLFLWHHPPSFMVLIYPLAFLPYIPAYFVWMAVTLALFLWMLTRLTPSPYTIPLALAFGGTFVNFFHGQIGFLIAALLGGMLINLEKRPVVAALCIALLTIKPHLGVLIPIALLLGGYWRVFGYAVVACLVYWALTTLMFGPEMWLVGVENLTTTRYVMDTGLLPWAKMPSLYATLMMLGGSTSLAYGAQIFLGLTIAGTVAWVWRGPATFAVKGAVLVSGSMLIPPYIFDYDLVVLAVAIALLAQDGINRGWRPYDREVLIVAALAPLFGPIVAEGTGVPLMFFMVVPLFVIAVRRALMSEEGSVEAVSDSTTAITVTADDGRRTSPHTD